MSINQSLKIIKDYTQWSFAITGNTYRHKESLKKLGGKYNKYLKCGAGWIFRKRDIDDVLKVVNEINSAELIILINSKTGRICDYINWTYSDLCQRYDSLYHYESEEEEKKEPTKFEVGKCYGYKYDTDDSTRGFEYRKYYIIRRTKRYLIYRSHTDIDCNYVEKNKIKVDEHGNEYVNDTELYDLHS
jgi:hypothetical protein